ncbi:MAG TPA: hypothetical protein VEG60_17870 [Candidatus Binatia bacterium]|nr:hypothetical protein [Candidatus Binatia bacterium]
MAGKKLVLKTSYAGDVTIDWGEVSRIFSLDAQERVNYKTT